MAAVADAAICRVLTLKAAKWREHMGDLDEPLYIIEITDPGASPGDPGPGQRPLRARCNTQDLQFALS